ncbi:MAG: PIN domain-containing protein [Acutalibacteraceae bacterium]|nr:PIN domain-containing protein [Acutalibacteraceae bacterium]
MKFYLVDYENVCINGLNGLSKLDENTTVCIFYSENNDKLSFGLHKRLCEAKANIKYFKANISSKNALDFQLTFYAGYLCSKYPDCEIIIISNDKEYDCLNKISNNLGSKITRASNLTGYNTQAEKEDLKIKVSESISSINIKNISHKELTEIIVEKIQTLNTRREINCDIQKFVKDSKKFSEIAKAIRPLTEDKN